MTKKEREQTIIQLANNLKRAKAYLTYINEQYNTPEDIKSILDTMCELYRIMAVKLIEKYEDEMRWEKEGVEF